MEGNLTGAPSGVICPLYVVVDQQSVHGEGGMAGGHSYRMKKERKDEPQWSGGNRVSCEGPHESILGSECS